MKRRQRLLSNQADDRGAALLLVLIVVTVVALAGAAMLSFSDTSLRTTVALRDQGAAAYAADGAAQVAISKLQNGSFPNKCATQTGDPLSLGNATNAFYQSAQSSSSALNAYVLCTPDPLTGTGVVVSSANKPADAIRTLGNDAGVVGQDYSKGAANKTVNVANGNVISESSIKTGSNTLAVTGTGVKLQAKSVGGCTGIFAPTACQSGTVLGPPTSYSAPTDPVSLAPPPVCTSTYAAFRPGLYNTSHLTTYLNGTCGMKSVVWFSPGTYYFDFTGTWTAPARLVGGTPTDSADKPITGLDPTNASTLSKLSQLNPSSAGACANPSDQIAPGVMFVFGGGSKVDLGSRKLEICATYSATSVPIAIYGPTTPIPVNGGTATSPVSAQTICKLDTCSLFQTSASGKAEFHIQGFTYAPNARIALTFKNSVGQMFSWGLVARSFSLAGTGSTPPDAFVQLPPNSVSTSYSVMYLSVWVCPAGASPCNSGPARLTAKVQVTGSPAAVTVLSWSVKR